VYFPLEERRQLAKVLIQKRDSVFSYHCDQKNCGHHCPFAYEHCPHIDCPVIYSRKWSNQHDQECPQKIIECERHCERHVMRRLMKNHLMDECVLRPVECSFASLGCESHLLQKDLKDHMECCQSDHLELTLKRILEQQGIISQLYHRMTEQETRGASLQQELRRMEGMIAAGALALKASETRHEGALQDQIAKVEQRCVKRTSDLQAKVHSETVALTKSIREVAATQKK